uniref:Trans-prenyltransferase 1 n=1 Tax=Haslea ostrearia TaxID=67476 RepID=A0A3G5BBW5_HASOS|nr:trans-prenyltransferase 1 [Haslea ostrearia]
MSSLVIPVVVAGVAAANLTDKLDVFATFFFDMEINEQIAFLALVFAVIFAAVGLSSSSSSKKEAIDVVKDHGSYALSKKPVAYPYQQIVAAKTDKEKFLCLYPTLRDEMLEHMKQNNEMIPEAVSWAQRMMDYTVPGGKLNRGTTVLAVFQTLKGRTLTELEVAQACVLGWTIEFLQAFFLVADDVMDGSKTRRGQPCWYLLENVKLISINDAFLLESFVFSILKKHFVHLPCYSRLVDLTLDIVQKTEFGQLLDLTSQEEGTIDLSRFTLERYKLIVKYKTAFYSFYLSVAMGMNMCGITDESAYDVAKEICMIMGEYFQIQDDYLDCYGDPKHIGKVGTDIQDNKCSWLVVQALDRCSDSQRKLLEENYGRWDDKKVENVKALYRELGLENVFKAYEEESYVKIQALLQQVKAMPKEVFEIFLSKIYKRSK